MRTLLPAVALIALLAASIAANAQAPCPELTRLRSEAQETLKKSMTVPQLERCHIYTQLSMAWDAVTQFANDHREVCQVSAPSLDAFERARRAAVKDRSNACAGRPLRPYGADVIQQ